MKEMHMKKSLPSETRGRLFIVFVHWHKVSDSISILALDITMALMTMQAIVTTIDLHFRPLNYEYLNVYDSSGDCFFVNISRAMASPWYLPFSIKIVFASLPAAMTPAI
ncbi:Uncharacterised protein [Staphylococcus intermedius NCTC 11048]|uniref:Uncharacterized protein n=1 Tax=Staphylococcus intermedius NCTC 11048 TaxID=1141106 RepID=A0A380G882_STAIN|nr:Uncharacterised protein [Staphylococcus intermedius NCTC 11048]